MTLLPGVRESSATFLSSSGMPSFEPKDSISIILRGGMARVFPLRLHWAQVLSVHPI